MARAVEIICNYIMLARQVTRKTFVRMGGVFCANELSYSHRSVSNGAPPQKLRWIPGVLADLF